MPGVRIVVLPSPLASRSVADVQQMAHDYAPEIVGLLTGDLAASGKRWLRIRFPYQLALLLASGLALWGCEVEPERTQLPPDVKATVDAAVSATLTATPPTAVPTPLSNPESTATPISAPTPTAAHSVTPTSTPLPAPPPTATARPTPLPTGTRPSPTARPTLAPIRTAAKRSETITTSLGQQVDAAVTGFADSPLRFDQLVLAINEGERLLGVPYPSPSVTMRQVSQLSGGFCGQNQPSYAARYTRGPVCRG